MLRWLVWSWLALFVWSGCDSSPREREQTERPALSTFEAQLRPDSSHGDEHDDEEDSEGCEENDDSGDVPPCDAETALVAFRANIQPSIDKSCHKCHAFAAGGLTMHKEEDDTVAGQNRANLKASAESASAAQLFLKISDQSSAGHGGGDQSDPEKGNLTLAKIEAWLAAEVGCD